VDVALGVERVATALRRTFPIEQSSDLHIELQPMHDYLWLGFDLQFSH
jgi:hypothetical protein